MRDERRPPSRVAARGRPARRARRCAARRCRGPSRSRRGSATSGSRRASWRTSLRLRSPPENPSFRWRSAKARSMPSRSIHSSSERRTSSTERSSCPSAPTIAWRRNWMTETPGIASGCWNARNSPGGRARRADRWRRPFRAAGSAAGPLVVGAAHHERGERRLAGPVRPHERVQLALVDDEVDAPQDLGAVGDARDVTELEEGGRHRASLPAGPSRHAGTRRARWSRDGRVGQTRGDQGGRWRAPSSASMSPLRGSAGRLAAYGPDDAARPSPCEGWSAGDVVEHSVGVVVMVANLVGDPVVDDGDGELSRYDRAVRTCTTRSPTRCSARPSWTARSARMALKQLVSGIVVHDLLVHTWDLARATGGDEHLDDELVAHTLHSMTPFDEVLRDHGFAREGAGRRRRGRPDQAAVLPRSASLTDGATSPARPTRRGAGRSTPIVVIAPWPGSTIVSSPYARVDAVADGADDDGEVAELGLRCSRALRGTGCRR